MLGCASSAGKVLGAAVEMVFMTKISVNDSERRGFELYAMFFIATYARILWATGQFDA